MRFLFLLVLLVLLAAVGLTALIESDPGYVLVSYGLTSVEMSFWVGLLLLFFFNIVCYALFRLLRRLLLGRLTLATWMQERKQSKGRRLTGKGLFSYMEGNWAAARRVLAQAAPISETPALNYLMAARASQALCEQDKVDRYLEAAAAVDTSAGKLVALTRAELLLEVGQLQEAAQVLETLQEQGGNDVQVLRLELHAYRGLQQWAKLAPLLPRMRKSKILAEPELQFLERQVFSGWFADARALADAAETEKVWSACPAALRKDTTVVASYVENLLTIGEHASADKLLERTLKKNWDAQLVNQYGLVESEEHARRIKVAERWLKRHPEDAVLLRCLGRLSLRNQLWGPARDYLESSYRLQADSETCAELARLLFNLGEREQSAQCYREGFLARENLLPELPQPNAASDQLVAIDSQT